MKIGHTIHFFDSLRSTNDYLDELCSKTDPSHGLAIVAAYQSDGKGQFGRNWIADKDKNILMSILLKPESLMIKEIARLHFFVSHAVVQLIRELIPEHRSISIKWPNDILIDEKKVGGILIKNGLGAQAVKHSIVGIGLNVFQREFDSDFRLKATSLTLEGAKINEKSEVLNNLLDQLNSNYPLLNIKDELKDRYLESLYGYQSFQTYTELESKNQFEAMLVDVGYDGSVLIERKDNGAIQQFMPGEIRLNFKNAKEIL